MSCVCLEQMNTFETSKMLLLCLFTKCPLNFSRERIANESPMKILLAHVKIIFANEKIIRAHMKMGQ